jgi:hypothetical protein
MIEGPSRALAALDLRDAEEWWPFDHSSASSVKRREQTSLAGEFSEV